MEQYRKDDRNVSRAIKRDCIKHVSEVQGKAGIRVSNASANRTVEGGSTTPPTSNAAIASTPHQTETWSEKNYVATSQNDSAPDSRRDLSTNPGQNNNAARFSTDPIRPTRQPVDISQLVQNMNLGHAAHSSDDEPE